MSKAQNSFDRVNNKILREMRPVDVFYVDGKFLARMATDSVGGESLRRLIGRYDATYPEYNQECLLEDMEWAERVML